jgi:hypothetical protein
MSADYTDLIARLEHDKWHISGVDAQRAADAIAALVAERDKAIEDCNAWAANYTELQAERDAAVADTRRLDWIAAQWRNGIHVEVCATRWPTWMRASPTATVYINDERYARGDLRVAIDAARQPTAPSVE